MSLNVRPYKVLQAANWRITHSKLYRDECVALNNDWINQYNEDINQDEINDESNLKSDTIDENHEDNIDSEGLDSQNKLHENGAETPAGVTDTMFTATEFLEEDERQNILSPRTTKLFTVAISA